MFVHQNLKSLITIWTDVPVGKLCDTEERICRKRDWGDNKGRCVNVFCQDMRSLLACELIPVVGDRMMLRSMHQYGCRLET